MDDKLGKNNFTSLMTDELLVVAYDYNSQEPRFYSKYFAIEDKSIYDVPVGNATGASSAAPLYFEPKFQKNQYGLEEL
jgi:patatin-like phospholipase/acyl hydrolase